ncbi:MAG: YiiX/YebB-like N1pC/P60 family cysteine hydrolase [Hyphomonadaceae bacterium]
MAKKLIKPALIAVSAGLGLIAIISLFTSRQTPPSPPNAFATKTEPIRLPALVSATLHKGDIIFRGKDRSWGDLGAQLSDRDKRFGHVGVIVGQPDNWAVIDAIGNPLDSEGSVRRRALSEFLSPATRASVYRPHLSGDQLDKFLMSIRQHEVAATPFDRFYDLGDQSALYCTELIWLALKAATGEDQIPEQTLFRNRRVIAIDDLQYAPLMTEIWTSGVEADT